MSAAIAPVAVRERPIPFSGPMVRAILAGTKTQTRRVGTIRQGGMARVLLGVEHERADIEAAPCRYGVPGDRLWVRETWGLVQMHELGQHIYTSPRIPDRQHVTYRAGKQVGVPIAGASPIEFRTEWRDDFKPERWRPSRFMFRWASRLTLEITGVRVERLQEITEEDAIAEGMDHVRLSIPADTSDMTARDIFEGGWDAINGKRAPWASNPWVWAVTFRRVA